MLSEEQIQNIRLKLLEQIENFPEEQRKVIKHKILSMSDEEFVTFLEENNLKYDEESGEDKEKKCIFCLISEGKLKSYKIEKNEQFIAILEINPLSKGHTLIIPKKHQGLKDMDNKILDIAKKISEKLTKTFSPKDIKLSKNEVLGHAMLEIIPIYGDETEKKRATDEELEKIQKEILGKKEEVREKPRPESQKPEESLKKVELEKIKLRIP